MSRVAIIAIFLVLAVAGLFFLRTTEGLSSLLDPGPTVSITLYDTNADGSVDLRSYAIDEMAVVWRWDRNLDDNPEVVAYDAAVAAGGEVTATGNISGWDFGDDGIIDLGEVPTELEEVLRSEQVGAAFATTSEGNVALVGMEVRELVGRIRAGYDEWRLKGFRMPIVGAHLPDTDNLLPGARRTYRNGIHQGFDMYAGRIGAPTEYGGPVVAAKGGTVLRADTAYAEMSERDYDEAIIVSKAAGTTPPDVLEKLRGRQIWIDHGHGIVTRYCHLAGIAPEVLAGDSIEAGTIIGFVGNSGLESANRGSRSGAHLHFELRIDSRYLGEGLSPSEIRRIARPIFNLPEPTAETP